MPGVPDKEQKGRGEQRRVLGYAAGMEACGVPGVWAVPEQCRMG